MGQSVREVQKEKSALYSSVCCLNVSDLGEGTARVREGGGHGVVLFV